MGLSAPGIGSGLDIKGMVEALVKADITPTQVRHDRKLNTVNTELSAVGQMKSMLTNLQSSLAKLSDLTSLYNMKYSTSDASFFSASITPQAAAGTYQVIVQKLAQQQSLASTYFANNVSGTGPGTINISFGSYSSDNSTFTANTDVPPVSIVIAPGNDSLTAVCAAINNSKSDVTAAIVQDSQGSRITLSSSTTGQNYAMKISSDITALNYDPTTGKNALTQTMAAQNSLVSVNGLVLSQSSNKLENALAGITLNLTKADPATTVTLTVDDNKDQVTNLINDFVKQYNNTMNLLTNLTGFNPETKQSGYLQGDTTLRNLKQKLTNIATSPVANNSGPLQSLADLGITTVKQGSLEINQDKFKQALADNYKDIGTLFAKSASTSDSTIFVNSVGSSVKAGTYAIDLSEYTAGTSAAGTIGGFSANSSDGIILNGSGELRSLSIGLLSGTLGSRGTITVTDGLASQLSEFLDTYNGTKGDLTQRSDQLNKEVKELSKDQERIDARIVSIQGKYQKQFGALDLLLSNLQTQSTSLSQLLANLPQYNNNSR